MHAEEQHRRARRAVLSHADVRRGRAGDDQVLRGRSGTGTGPGPTASEAADELGDDEAGRRRRRDAGEGVGERAADGDGGVGEAGRRREPVGGGDVAADRERQRRCARPERTTPRITSSSPNVATTSPSQMPRRRAAWVETVDGRQVEHEVGDDRARRTRRRSARRRRRRRRRSSMPPKRRSARVTTGLKWAPDTGPKARISATSPAPVAVEFSSSCRPTSSGDRRWAEMPEPTTMATRNAVPTSSAVAAPRRGRVDRSAQQQRAGGLPGAGRAAHRPSAAGSTVRSSPGGHLDVGQHGVDLPRLAVGIVDPHLVLHRVATRDLVLGGGGQALGREASLRRRRPRRSVSTSTPRWLSVPARRGPR